MKIGKWTAWLGVVVLVAAVLFNWIGDAQQEDSTRSAGVEPRPTSLLGSVDRSARVAQIDFQASAEGGELTHHKAFAYEAVVEAMGPTPTKIAATENEVRLKRRLGASDDEIYRFRAAIYSAEKATLLAEMERAEKDWNLRVQSYLTEKSRLANSNNAAKGADQSVALQQLRNTRFTAEEQNLLTASEPFSGPQLILQPE